MMLKSDRFGMEMVTIRKRDYSSLYISLKSDRFGMEIK